MPAVREVKELRLWLSLDSMIQHTPTAVHHLGSDAVLLLKHGMQPRHELGSLCRAAWQRRGIEGVGGLVGALLAGCLRWWWC